MKSLLKSEDELSSMYTFEFQDPEWSTDYSAEALISVDRCETGLRRFLMEKCSIIALGIDKELERMAPKIDESIN